MESVRPAADARALAEGLKPIGVIVVVPHAAWIVTTGSGEDGDEVQVQAVFSTKEKAIAWVQRWRVKRGQRIECTPGYLEGQYDRYFEINDWWIDPED